MKPFQYEIFSFSIWKKRNLFLFKMIISTVNCKPEQLFFSIGQCGHKIRKLCQKSILPLYSTRYYYYYRMMINKRKETKGKKARWWKKGKIRNRQFFKNNDDDNVIDKTFVPNLWNYYDDNRATASAHWKRYKQTIVKKLTLHENQMRNLFLSLPFLLSGQLTLFFGKQQ